MELINVHEHLESERQLPALLRSMDLAGIERVVVLGSSAFTITSNYRRGFTKYDENNRAIIAVAAAHPDRIEAWPTLNPLDPDNGAKLRRYHEMGATGLKLYMGHGFVAPGSSSYFFSPLALDAPQMEEVYDYCVRHRLPICLHVNPGPKTPGFADEFVSLLEQHPGLLVNAPHWILSSGKTSRLAELLDVFPNLVTDVSLGVDTTLTEGLRRISKNFARIRRVVQQHPSRFLFGTDFVVTSAHHKTPEWMAVRIEAYRSMLTCAQYETQLLPSEVLNGLALPGDVVAQIGSRNYAHFRAPERQPAAPARPVDWSRMGLPRPRRLPGERLPFIAQDTAVAATGGA
jgi:predicted TIM-barrel fold metal-dependent hydrolase